MSMKTIQEHFREADADELVNAYIFEHPLTFNPADEIREGVTISEMYKRYESDLHQLIERIRTIETVPDPNGSDWVFFVRHTVEHDGSDIDVALVKQDELLDLDSPLIPYAYNFSPAEETAGIPVADTYLTQRYLDDVLIDYMFEVSFFGMSQEHLQDAVDALDEAVAQSKEHPEDLHPISELYEALDYEPERYDETEREAWRAYVSSEAEYCKVASDVERRKVAESLRHRNTSDD